MFYATKVRILKNKLLQRIARKLLPAPAYRATDNALMIKRYAPGKTFADIGCMWGINGGNSFLAEESGAKSVTALDIYPESPEFIAEKARRNSKITYVNGDISTVETTQKLGTFEVVFCSGVLYHTPDPFGMLMRLRSISSDILILNTETIPEMPGIKNGAVYYPYLSESQRGIWRRGRGSQKAITGPYEPESGYANWFWGMTPSCLEALLQSAGFTVLERHSNAFLSLVVCKAAPAGFVSESGAWSTPKDADFLSHKDR